MPWWKRAVRTEQRVPSEVDRVLREALLAVLDRDLERAEDLLSGAVRMDSGAVESYIALARLYRMRGEIGRAIRIHQNLLMRADLTRAQSTAVLADLAADFRQGGFLQRAIASYEEVLAHDPRHLPALRALVPLLSSVRNYRRAIEVARRLAKAEGGNSAVREAALLVEMAEAAQAEGRSEDARRALKRALRRDPRSVPGWIALGGIEAERGRVKAALDAWSKVPAIDRHSGPLVYPRLEATYAALDRPREFETYLHGMLAEQPDDAHARVALAGALAARGAVEEAIAELRRASEHQPGNLAARGALGRLLLSERREEDAVREYGELLDALEQQGLLRDREKLA
jgi:lipopolysaccharide biosynthesis regulator YciM